MYDSSDTIVALSTPPGRSGVAVLRLSGPLAFSAADRLLRPRNAALAADRRMRLADAVDPHSNAVVDEVMVVLFPAPRTYTCENMVEIQCHGSPAVVARLIELALAAGCRQAEPGEFTLRAFQNGRIDLAQAEAVAALIQAESLQGAAEAARQLAGGLSAEIEQLRAELLGPLAALEAAVDFPEDELPEADPRALALQLERPLRRCHELARSFERGRLLEHGVRAAVVGLPNAGKSSLFNALLGRERALVHERPGTTRDVIEDRLMLAGLPIALADTAGLRPEQGATAPIDPVELAGMERTRQSVAQADLLLVVFDLGRGIEPADLELWRSLAGRPAVAVLNKCDIAAPGAVQTAQRALEAECCVIASARTGQGLDELAAALAGLVTAAVNAGSAGPVLISARHAALAADAAAALERGRTALEQGVGPEFAALELRQAAACLSAIIGRSGTDRGRNALDRELLDKIFSEFCIGK